MQIKSLDDEKLLFVMILLISRFFLQNALKFLQFLCGQRKFNDNLKNFPYWRGEFLSQKQKTSKPDEKNETDVTINDQKSFIISSKLVH